MNTREHDNIDRDIIKINKDSLLLRIVHCKDYYTSQIAAPTFFGISISFLTSGFLSESFTSIGPIPGETIRSTLLLLGVVTFVLALYFIWKWYQARGEHEPKNIVKSLLKAQGTSSPIEMTDTPRGKKIKSGPKLR